jgi:uncharacterized membrane protein
VTADEQEDADGARALAERLHDPARVLALSDGVFAIIITLLVLEVHVPELGQGQSLVLRGSRRRDREYADFT